MDAMEIIAAALAFTSAGACFGEDLVVNPPPQNVVQLSAAASVDVRQDLLTLVLAATREGAEPTAVQSELKQALDAALAQAKNDAAPDRMDVHTGSFGLYPRYGKDGRITTWQGRAELVLEGRDFARIGATAGRIQGMTVVSSVFGLSREQRDKAQRDVQAAAIQNWRSRADEIAKGFGFGGYTLREASVQSNDQFPPPRPRMMMEAKVASADAPVPVEAGNSTVQVIVSGSVQLK